MKIIKKAKERTKEDNRALRQIVADMIDDVCENKDAALAKYNQRFDQCERDSLRISPEEIQDAYRQITQEELDDLKAAKANIEKFAIAQRGTMTELDQFSPQPGILLGHRIITVSS